MPGISVIAGPEGTQDAPEQWRCIGQEVTDQLDYEPARFVRRRQIRRKYVSRRHPERAPVTAPLHILQDRCLAAPGLLAQLIVSKMPPIRSAGLGMSRGGGTSTFGLGLLDQSRSLTIGRTALDDIVGDCFLLANGTIEGYEQPP